MKVIIAGSRTVTLYEIVESAVMASPFDITEIVSGRAAGVDMLGEQFADNAGLPVAKFPADWNKYGKSAGHRRNAEMGMYADCLVAIWNGSSTGTKNMIETMRGFKKPVIIHTLTAKEVCLQHLAGTLKSYELLRNTFSRREYDTAIMEKLDALQRELALLESSFRRVISGK